jgi:tripartite motif-containing protein 71
LPVKDNRGSNNTSTVTVTDKHDVGVFPYNSKNYSYLKQWGSNGTGNGQFIGPNDIAIDSSGYVYVTDSFNNRIQVFSPLTTK